ncbi:hypothetical protein ACFL6D_04555 [Spirochaetota bacterium]
MDYKKGKNLSIYDRKGNKYLDLSQAIHGNTLGYAPPVIQKTLKNTINYCNLPFRTAYNSTAKNLRALIEINPFLAEYKVYAVSREEYLFFLNNAAGEANFYVEYIERDILCLQGLSPHLFSKIKKSKKGVYSDIHLLYQQHPSGLYTQEKRTDYSNSMLIINSTFPYMKMFPNITNFKGICISAALPFGYDFFRIICLKEEYPFKDLYVQKTGFEILKAGISYIIRKNINLQAERIGSLLKTSIEKLVGEGAIKGFSGEGLNFRIEFRKDIKANDKKGIIMDGKRIFYNGISALVNSKYLYISPAFCMSDDRVQFIIKKLAELSKHL